MLLYSPAGFGDIFFNTFIFDAINVICENITYFHPDSATEPPVSPSQCHERLRTWLIGELPCIIYKIGIFLFDAFLLYLILSRKILRRHLGKKQYELCYEQRKLDPDVAKEINVVEEICRIRNFESHSLVACNVHKYYGDIFAVRGISFALRPSECLGLLGVNGAGKTTILQVLAGLCTFERGEVHSGNMKLTSDPVKVNS
ncbi:hypothetical protein HPB48_021753 [Haemaphysalis longicornis]|uniref:ABC transporter domain-containing protein n=1 Tax=Haemaphysalis longicornis TaxID=44386 RepID=A0A9J6GGS4_HAELO|nr:hypothetical protein HPB48_021753 [Haemaphysalis longicornis]